VRTPFADHSIRRVFSRIVANLPLVNSITGPPVNLAITPDQRLALVANSLDWVKDGEDWRGIPDTKIFVIDLTASPPCKSPLSKPASNLRAWRSTRQGPSRWLPTAPTTP
jgi:hypothetical protein